MEFRFYPDWLGALTAYERGEVQGIAKIPLDLVDEAVRETSLVLHHAPLSSYGLVFLNLRRSVFQDRAVRQALMWALDREGLIEHALKGQAIVADGPVPPFSWAYEPHTTQYSFRPTMARRLLDESGWTDEDGDGVREKDGAPLQFELVTNEDATRVSVVQELARQWADVGVRVVTATAGLAGIVREYLVPRDYDAVFYDFQRLPTDPDPYALWHSTQVAEGGQNYAGYGSEQADVLMEEARRTSYKDSRASLYRELQAILADDLPTLPLYFSVYTYVLDRAVQAVQLAPMWEPSDRFRTIQDWHMGKHRSTVSEAPFLTRPTSESP
jgi:peptide/nickel transport system substrate-binding protein